MPLHRIFPFLSTSVLFLTFGTITFGTNLFLASWLPDAYPPAWTDQEHQQLSVIGKASILSSWINQQPPENDDGDLLHVLTTRFMQHQPNLLALGEARLLLFETLCLPSMKLQTTDDFVWAVLADPDLDRFLLDRLVALLSPYPHFYLILSNDKEFSIASIQERGVVITGDVSKLYALLNSRNRRLLLQTRLDADDGLSRRTLQKIQDVARALPNDHNVGWQIVCAGLHYEWRNDDITSFNVTTAGKLRLIQEAICVTPGYTLIKHRNSTSMSINFPKLPHIEHHLVNREWPECLRSATGNAKTDCWTKLKKRYPAALRGRTITSAGMSRIGTKPSERVWDNQTDIFWGLVTRDYGILREQALETSLYLQQHLIPIVEDNLRGQW
jgi:hypothetical protein